jgi:hypothetical protein
LPIPALDENGLLPVGVHECTLEEIEASFGQFLASDRRPRLFRDLKRYVDEVRVAAVGRYLVVNGSYVTGKPNPNDIDVLLILRDDLDLSQPVPPFEYNARSKKYVRKQYGLDFYVGFEGDESSERILRVFTEVKLVPGATKGILKIAL